MDGIVRQVTPFIVVNSGSHTGPLGMGWHGMIQSDPMDFKLVCSRFQVKRKRNDVLYHPSTPR